MTHTLKIAMMRSPAAYWKAACDFGSKGFTTSDLSGCTCGIAHSTVRQWIQAMRRQGELVVVGSVPGIAGKERYLYAVKRKREKAPVVRRPDFKGALGRAQEQLWNTMRMLKESWTLSELALTASTEEVLVSRNTANKYVAALVRAGIVQAVKAPTFGAKGHMGAVAGRYRLTRKITGPKPPQVLAAQFVFDPNSDKIIGESEVRNGLV